MSNQVNLPGYGREYTAGQTGDVPAVKEVAQVCDVVLRKIKYWTEKRRRVAVVVPPQRVLESRYAIVAETN